MYKKSDFLALQLLSGNIIAPAHQHTAPANPPATSDWPCIRPCLSDQWTRPVEERMRTYIVCYFFDDIQKNIMVSYSRVRQTALSTLMTAPKSPLFFSIFFRIEALFCHFRLSTFYLILHPPSSQLLVVFRSILIISLHPLECLSLSLFGVDAFLFFQFLSFRHFDGFFSFALCFLNFIR